MSRRPLHPSDTLEAKILRLLHDVEKPGRYIGGEWNAVRKEPGRIRLRIGLVFPDVYEIGMSYLGQKILYEVLNSREGLAAERIFAPWPDMEEKLRGRGLPLFSLETKTPLRSFDILGFSLLYELNDSNILTILDLAGIQFFSAERGSEDPLIIAGGPAAFNPEPLAAFFDAFVLGDGEEAFVEVAEAYGELKTHGASRESTLAALGRIPGVYVPLLYAAARTSRSPLVVSRPLPGAPEVVRKRVATVWPGAFPERIIVPHVQAVHDRVAVEVARGCPQRCRFCQASAIYFPHRYKDPAAVVAPLLRSLEATGYEDASLSALSISDYPYLDRTVDILMRELAREGVSLSLSSLRPGGLSNDVIQNILKVRKTGFTLVPEAGTERLRRVINKNLGDEDLLAATRSAFAQGWRLLKLYFMIGLPTESQDDLEGIGRTIGEILEAGKEMRGRAPQVHVSVSSFIPKPHTPFQWLGMEDRAVLEDKLRFLRSRIKRFRSVKLKPHAVNTSVLEAVFSRGDRRLGSVLIEAWRRGARFDGWKDTFRTEYWDQAMAACQVDPRDYLGPLDLEAILPWDHIDTGLRKSYLKNELARALRQEPTAPCSETNCGECLGCVPEWRPSKTVPEPMPVVIPSPGRELPPSDEILRYRTTYVKQGPARFLSHNDMTNALRRTFRRARVSVLQSAGFHPKMVVSYLPALPLGMEGRAEVMEFKSSSRLAEPDFLERMNANTPPGLRFTALMRLEARALSLGESLKRMVYSFDWTDPEVEEALRSEASARGLGELEPAAALESLLASAFPERETAALKFNLDHENGRLMIDMAYSPQGSARPQDVVRRIVPIDNPVFFMVRERVLGPGLE